MPLLDGLRERVRGRGRVACRTEHGHRTAITAVPLSDGRGVRLKTGLGDLVLTCLEAGHLRGELRDAIITSAELSTEDTEQ